MKKKCERLTGKTRFHLTILQGTGETAGQPTRKHRSPAGTGRESAEEVEASKEGNQRAEDERCVGKRHHSIADGISSLLGGSKVKRLEAQERKFEARHCRSAKQVQAEQREQAMMENRHNNKILRIDQSYLQKIAEYDNRLKQIDTYFPIVTELLPIAEQCREVGFTEELTRQIVSLQPVEFKRRLYSKKHKEKFRTEHSTATMERNPQEKGKFRLCIDGMPILEWFKMKFQELKEKLGISRTQKEESTPKGD